jgi:Skp family chaperone for outer membrane proteins
MKVRSLGWIVAAALIGVAALVGFQGTTAKIGVVDMAKVFAESDFAKAQTDSLRGFGTARQAMLEFVDTYRVFTPEQATKFHDLSVKPNPTAAEKGELEKVKTDVQTADKRLKELQTKTNMTPAESAEMSELSRRVQSTTDTAQRWSRDADDELRKMQADSQKAVLDKVREAVKQVGTSGSYTVIFVSELAPYGANDVTKEALVVMNKK